MDKEGKSIFTCLGAILYVVGFAVAEILVNGWVISILWGWFIVPVFKIPTLNILQAYGLALVVGILTKQDIDVKSPERSITETIIRGIGVAVLRPLFTLGFGWIVLQFMK